MTAHYRKQAIPVLTLVTVLIGIGVVIQLWLLSASLEAVLAGDASLPIPATIVSAVVLLANGGLLAYVLRVDHRISAQGTRRP